MKEYCITARQKVLVTLEATMAMVLLASNFMAAKLWNFFGIPVDGGLLLFPVSYVVGDILVELYGRKTANFIACITAIPNAVAMLMLSIAVYLPPFPGWDGQSAYALIFSLSLRVTLGSLAGYLLSQITNNYAFLQIKGWQSRKRRSFRSYKIRAIGSSLIGRLVDNVIFETIAFLGILPFKDFLKQFLGAYFEGLIVEIIIVLVVSEPIINKVREYITDDEQIRSESLDDIKF